jgi:hypothetical protein
MATISVNNGNTYRDVADLTDQEIADVLASGGLDQEISDRATGDNDRAWLDSYCQLHMDTHQTALIIG